MKKRIVCTAGMFLFATLCANAVEAWTGSHGHEMVVIGDVGQGSVDYEYSLGKYEVTNTQYVEFLNAVGKDAAATYDLYNSKMASHAWVNLDETTGKFYVGSGYEKVPVGYVTAYAAAYFCNWLSTGDLTKGAYTFSAEKTNKNTQTNFCLSTEQRTGFYVLPTEKELEKGGFYDPTKVNGDGSVGGFWKYATRTDEDLVDDVDANFGGNDYACDVGTFKPSYYGTYDQSGNVGEWTSTTNDGYDLRYAIGGNTLSKNSVSLSYELDTGHACDLGGHYPEWSCHCTGIRLAYVGTIPEPSAFGLLAGLGALALAISRRKRRK